MSTMTTLFQSLRPPAVTSALPAREDEFQATPELDAKADSDRALLKRYAETGSGDAFAEIVYRHSAWVFHTCRRSLHDVHLAEDATQAVFLLLSRKVLSISPQTHIAGWLYQACRYVLIDIRKHQTRYHRRQDIARDMALQRLTSSANTQESLDPELAAALDGAIAGLSAGHREAILMHFYEGLTLQQMAEQLGISKDGAKKRVTRALSCLRTKLGGKTKRVAAVPIAAILLLLRSRGAEAAPPDIAAAVAQAATTPGVSSTVAEMMIEGVRQAMITATDRLLVRLATIVAKVALFAIVLLMASRGWHRAGERIAVHPPGKSALAIGPVTSASAIAVLRVAASPDALDPPESPQAETHEQPANSEPAAGDQKSKVLPKLGGAVAEHPADQRGIVGPAPIPAQQTARTSGKTELASVGTALSRTHATQSASAFWQGSIVEIAAPMIDARRQSTTPPLSDRDAGHHHDVPPPDDRPHPPHFPPPDQGGQIGRGPIDWIALNPGPPHHDIDFDANAFRPGNPQANPSHPLHLGDGLPVLIAAMGGRNDASIMSVRIFDSHESSLHFNPIEFANHELPPGMTDMDGWESRPIDPLKSKAWPVGVGIALQTPKVGNDESHDATGFALSQEKWLALNPLACSDGQFMPPLELAKAWDAMPELHATIVPEPSTAIWAIATCFLALRRRIR